MKLFGFLVKYLLKGISFYLGFEMCEILFLFFFFRRIIRRNYWYVWRKWLNSVYCKILIFIYNDINVNIRGVMGVGFGFCIFCGLELVVRLDFLV